MSLWIRGWKRWAIAGTLGVAAMAVGGPFVYIHFIEGKAPAPLALSSATSSPDASTAADTPVFGSPDGTWVVASGSEVGYRVQEVLFGQSNTAVGRTSSIKGSMVVSGTTVQSATFTVDMTTVTSDQDRRDRQFNGRIMDTSSYPTATFTLTKAIQMGSIPTEGVTRTVTATGTLTMHGVSRTVTFQISGRRTGSEVEVQGSIPIAFADWGIPNPSFGPVSTEDHGTLEFLITFRHA